MCVCVCACVCVCLCVCEYFNHIFFLLGKVRILNVCIFLTSV